MKSGLEQRAEKILATPPHLIADVTLYATAEGGAMLVKHPGWGCLCCRSKTDYVATECSQRALFGYDGWPQLTAPLAPGEQRRLGFVFLLSGNEAAEALQKVGTFYLWEGRFIGEARIAN